MLLPNLLDDGGVRHNLALESAYCTVMGQEPLYTNFTAQVRSAAHPTHLVLERLRCACLRPQFTGVLDYLWYSSPHLRPLAVSPIPELIDGIGLPNVQYASDHLLLCADMQLSDS